MCCSVVALESLVVAGSGVGFFKGNLLSFESKHYFSDLFFPL